MRDDIAIIDFETRSDVDLKAAGVERYAESPETRVLCLAWCFGDGRVHVESDDGQLTVHARFNAPLQKLFDHVAAGGIVVAHNARFELTLWRMMAARYGWPELKIEQLRCTAAAARAMSLPAGLEQLAKALRLPVEKDMTGHRLMLKMCKPRKPRKGEPADGLLWHESPADLEALARYCARDIETEREVFKTLLPLSPPEQELWAIDQRINDRGVYLDLEGVAVCYGATEVEKVRLAAEMRAATGGAVRTPNAAKDLRAWLAANGVPLDDLRKQTVADALKRDIPPAARRALEIRQEAAKASTAKLKAMLRGACADGRARGLLEYHGAGTGRWAGRRVQTQNMPRTPDDFEPADAENIIDWLRRPGGPAGVRVEYGSVMDATSWALRSLIKAAPGKRLLCADYSNIEGRGLAWLAGEEWKLQAFRDLDAGTGHDLYKLAYARSFGLDVADVSKPQRQIGKVQELALGYQGGHGAFLNMAAGYGINLDAIAAAVREAVALEKWQDAEARYWAGARETAEELLAERRLAARLADAEPESPFAGDNGGPPLEESGELFDLMSELAKANRYDLSAPVWSAIRIIVDSWRAAHPQVVNLWKQLETAATAAIDNPGDVASVGHAARYMKSGDYLLCQLPSRRCIVYPYARIERVVSRFENADGTPRYDRKITFDGVDGKTKRWMKQRAYGGLLAENVTQAWARDVLADGIKRLERAGYPIVMHVHDETVAELPLLSAHTLPEFERLMSVVPSWAPGAPIAVAGWEGERYRK